MNHWLAKKNTRIQTWKRIKGRDFHYLMSTFSDRKYNVSYSVEFDVVCVTRQIDPKNVGTLHEIRQEMANAKKKGIEIFKLNGLMI